MRLTPEEHAATYGAADLAQAASTEAEYDVYYKMGFTPVSFFSSNHDYLRQSWVLDVEPVMDFWRELGRKVDINEGDYGPELTVWLD